MSDLVRLTGRRGPTARHDYRPSRYTHLAPLRGGGAIAWNALGGDLTRWSAEEVAAYERLTSDEGAPTEPALLDRLSRTRHVYRKAMDEAEVARGLFDQERFGKPVLTLALFARGPESGPAREPMNATIRAGVAALALAAAPNLLGIEAAWAGHEPLAALLAVGDLSLRLAEVAASRRLRYAAAVHTDAVGLTPEIAGKLPALEIRHVEVRVRAQAGALGVLERVLHNVRAAQELGQLSFHLHLQADDEHPDLAFRVLDRIAEAGVLGAPGGMALGGGAFRTCHRHTGLSAPPRHEAALLGHAHRLGFIGAQPLPRFLGQCQATKHLSYAVAPNGDLHKCWSTVHSPELRSGNVCDPRSLQLPSAHRQRWMFWDPFSDAVCRECAILPLCAGHCADLHPADPGAQIGPRPCPAAKHDLPDRLLAAARIKGILKEDDHGPI